MESVPWANVLLLIGLIEVAVENVKWLFEQGWSRDRIIAFSASVLICPLAGLDLFALTGWPLQIPIVGSILTGVLAARGATVLHDLIKLPGVVGLRLKS